MAAVRGKHTTPELRVRSQLHAMGYRFRLHRKDLPGNLDIVLTKYRPCIFIHGCFWHQHPGCKRVTIPETRREFWREKFLKNRIRDEKVQNKLRGMGWHVCTIWECKTKKDEGLTEIIAEWFKNISNEC